MTELLLDETIVGETLTPKQEAFCQYYTQISTLFGNGTLAYAEAYGYDLDNASRDDAIYEEVEKNGHKVRNLVESSTYSKFENICAVCSSKLLRNAKVDKRVRELLNDMLTDHVVDARLIEIIMNGKDTDSIAAIKEFNKLKQRIVEKQDITSNGESIAGFNFVKAENYVDARTQEERDAEPVTSTFTTTGDPFPEPIFESAEDNTNNQTNS